MGKEHRPPLIAVRAVPGRWFCRLCEAWERLRRVSSASVTVASRKRPPRGASNAWDNLRRTRPCRMTAESSRPPATGARPEGLCLRIGNSSIEAPRTAQKTMPNTCKAHRGQSWCRVSVMGGISIVRRIGLRAVRTAAALFRPRRRGGIGLLCRLRGGTCRRGQA